MNSLAGTTLFANSFNNRAKFGAAEISGGGIIHMARARGDKHRMEPFDNGSKKGVRNDNFPTSRIFI